MKIAIIGAGIVGPYLAWKLAERGEEITVFEKKEKIGKKCCSGLFSERILDFIPEARNLIQNQIESVLVHFPKGTFRIQFSKSFLLINRFELDNLVVKLAENFGAKIILNYNISRFDLDKLGEKFDRIIGCDGVNSTVRKSLRLPEPDYYLAIKGSIFKDDYSNFVETWPVSQGFIWKIPRGKEIEYGIIGNPKGAKLLFDNFLKKNNLRLERLASGLVPQGLIIPSHPKITLCGDAAGLTKPWSGGGVIWGLLVADILLKNFPDFLKYKSVVKKFFLPKIIFSKMITKMVYFLGFKFPWILPKNIKIEGDFLL